MAHQNQVSVIYFTGGNPPYHPKVGTPECPNVKKLKRVGYTSMALNTLKCNHLTTLGLKGLNKTHVSQRVNAH